MFGFKIGAEDCQDGAEQLDERVMADGAALVEEIANAVIGKDGFD